MTVDTESHKRIVEIWLKTVDTQMHFNEMSVKSRQLGLTFVTAALGVAVVLLANDREFSFSLPILGHEITVHVAVILIFGAYLAIAAVQQLDLNVYHKMLRGAVTFGEDLEETYLRQEIFSLNKGMTQAISHYSRYSDADKTLEPNGKYKYTGQSKTRAQDKIEGFYEKVRAFLLFAVLILFLFNNPVELNLLFEYIISIANSSDTVDQ